MHHDNYVSVKENESDLKISKDNDHEDYSEDSDNDSDTLEPYICPECGEECDDLENFTDHFKQVQNL